MNLSQEDIDKLFWFQWKYGLCQTLLQELSEHNVPVRDAVSIVHWFASLYLHSDEYKIKSYMESENKIEHLSQHTIERLEELTEKGEYKIIKEELLDTALECEEKRNA